jgi:hypothetical protein
MQNVLHAWENGGSHQAPPHRVNGRGLGTEGDASMQDQPTVGLCQCGCGEITPLSTRTNKRYRRGEPLRFAPGHAKRVPISERFWPKVDKDADGGCWVWTASRNEQGYGCCGFNGRTYTAHRLSYELARGPIPPGMHVLHRCDNPPCVNPEHLFVGDQSDNMRDMYGKGRGANRQGELSGAAKLTESQVREIKQLIATATARRSPQCSEPGCERPSKSLGMCSVCYSRRRRAGTLPPNPRLNIERIAAEFGVAPSTVRAIRDGLTWTHVNSRPFLSAVKAEEEW